MAEYIVEIDESYSDYDEIFVGVLRKNPELVRCKDCEFLGGFYEYMKGYVCRNDKGPLVCQLNGYCFYAKRRPAE